MDTSTYFIKEMIIKCTSCLTPLPQTDGKVHNTPKTLTHRQQLLQQQQQDLFFKGWCINDSVGAPCAGGDPAVAGDDTHKHVVYKGIDDKVCNSETTTTTMGTTTTLISLLDLWNTSWKIQQLGVALVVPEWRCTLSNSGVWGWPLGFFMCIGSYFCFCSINAVKKQLTRRYFT